MEPHDVRSSELVRGGWPLVGGLLLGLAAAVALRVGVAGADGARSAVAGASFAVVLAGLAVLGGWRPHVPGTRALAVGLLGGWVLCLVPLAVMLRDDGQALGTDGLALWAACVIAVAVAEEALLRGALHTAVERRAGTSAAVVVGAVAFALLHVPLYGWAVVPLDVAVGLWLGTLRAATGGTAAPATAHVVADLAGWWVR